MGGTSIDTQALATQSISENLGQASKGIVASNQRVVETTHVTQSIAREIAEVSAVGKRMTDANDHVRAPAVALAARINELREVCGGFKVD